VVPEPARRRGPSRRVLALAVITTVAAIGALAWLGAGSRGDSSASGPDDDWWPSEYRVRRGDTSTSVARMHGWDVEHLLDVWGLTLSDSLEPSSVLPIPPLPVEGHAWPPALATDPSRAQLHPTFVRIADEYGVPAPLVEALAWEVSQWDSTLVDEDAEVGIGRLDPETVRWLDEQIVHEPLDPRSAESNIRLTTAYLAHLLEATGGDHAATLAAYYEELHSAYTAPWDLDVVAFVHRVLTRVPDFEAEAPPTATTAPPPTTTPSTTN